LIAPINLMPAVISLTAP